VVGTQSSLPCYLLHGLVAALKYSNTAAAHQVLVFSVALLEVWPKLVGRECVHQRWVDIMLLAM
jgi:hypothetical protein